MKKLCICMILIATLLTGCGAEAREAWSYELSEAADDLLEVTKTKSKNDESNLILLKSGWFDNAKRTEIYLMNSRTGKSHVLAEFTCPPGQSIITMTGVYGNLRDLFTPDWTKMAATAYVDGLAHAGWIDQDSNFTDVTEALGLESRRDDSGYTDYSAVGFDRQLFYYRQRSTVGSATDGDWKFYAVNIHELQPESVIAVDAKDPYVYFWENAYQGTQSWSQTVQDQMRPSAVINQRYILSDYGDGLLTGNQRNFVITTPEYAIPVFEDETVATWSPVLSPDGRSIGYLSRSDAEETTSICTMSLKNGEVKTLNTGELLSTSYDEAGEQVTYTILGWH